MIDCRRTQPEAPSHRHASRKVRRGVQYCRCSPAVQTVNSLSASIFKMILPSLSIFRASAAIPAAPRSHPCPGPVHHIHISFSISTDANSSLEQMCLQVFLRPQSQRQHTLISAPTSSRKSAPASQKVLNVNIGPDIDGKLRAGRLNLFENPLLATAPAGSTIRHSLKAGVDFRRSSSASICDAIPVHGLRHLGETAASPPMAYDIDATDSFRCDQHRRARFASR